MVILINLMNYMIIDVFILIFLWLYLFYDRIENKILFIFK